MSDEIKNQNQQPTEQASQLAEGFKSLSQNPLSPDENQAEKVKNAPVKTEQKTDLETIQNPTVFQPTKTMIKWISTGFTINSQKPTEIARKIKGKDKAKSARLIWYDWQDVPGFLEWWNTQWQRFYDAQKYRLIDIGMKKAKDDHAYFTDMMEFYGFKKPAGEAPQNLNQFNLMAGAFTQGVKDRGIQVEEAKP